MVSGFHFATIKYNPRYFTFSGFDGIILGILLRCFHFASIKYNPRYFTWLVGSILQPLSIILGILHG